MKRRPYPAFITAALALLAALCVLCIPASAGAANAAEVSTDGGTSWTGYGTFADAWAAAHAEGTATVKLLADVDTSNHPASAWPINVASGKTITLDLNGCEIDRGLTERTYNGNVMTVSGGLTLTGAGRITGGNVPLAGGNGGGGVRVVGGGVFTMYSGEITGNRADNGGGVFVSSGGAFTMEGGSVSGNSFISNGGGVLVNGGTFVMNGGEISGNKAPGGRGNGGGVNLSGSGDFSMNGGAIYGNEAYCAGGISIYGANTLNMSGGRIYGNRTTHHSGGVFVGKAGMFTMSGGEIAGNTSGTQGGGVRIYDNGKFAMSGGSITGNTAQNGGGVYYDKAESTYGGIELSGKPVITGNTNASGATNNVYLETGVVVILDAALEAGASIGVTTQTKPTSGSLVDVTGANSADYRQYFSSDDAVYGVVNTGTGSQQVVQLGIRLQLAITYKDGGGGAYSGNNASALPATHTVGTDTALVAGTGDNYTFSGWYTASDCTGTALTTLGAYDYTADITLYAKWAGYAVTLDGNGATSTTHTLSVTATYGEDMPTANVVMPTRDHYSFSGYYDAEIGGTQYYTETGASAHIWDKTDASPKLYAHWTEIRYTILFTTQPAASTMVTAGSITESLAVVVSVTPVGGTATLNWYACNHAGAIYGRSLGTGDTFYIPATLKAGTYYYRCQATHVGATATNSDVATVTVESGPVDPDPIENLVSGITPGQGYTQGDHMTFTITGGGSGNTSPKKNDKRYRGLSWNVKPSEAGDFASGDTQSFPTAGMSLGAHTLTIVFVKQEYDGAQWADMSPAVTDTKAVTFTLRARPAPPRTGDSGKPLMWLSLCVLSGTGLATLLCRRRRGASPGA